MAPNATGKSRMTAALGVQVDRIFVGHSHFDHALDVRTAAHHYGAPVSAVRPPVTSPVAQNVR